MSSTNTSYQYFLKGDISGIQEFIFNVSSSGAARALRVRSIFIQVFSIFAQKYVEKDLKVDKVDLFFNGGGSFYLELSTVEQSLDSIRSKLKSCEKALNKQVHREDIYISLSIIEKSSSEFKDNWKKIAQKSTLEKLQKYQHDIEVFKPYSYCFGEKSSGEDSLQRLLASEESNTSELIKSIVSDLYESLGLEKVEYHIEDYESVVSELPKWDDKLLKAYEKEIDAENERRALEAEGGGFAKISQGSVIDYHFLGLFAKERTGTKKIGILKMDVDSLGLLFENINDPANARKVSKSISDFFGKTIFNLLEEDIQFPASLALNKRVASDRLVRKYSQNVYTVFAGGDDCIFVGAWDVIMLWAKKIHKAFQPFGLKIEKLLDSTLSRQQRRDLTLPPTLSASITVVETTYPVIRFADLADANLYEAKSFIYSKDSRAKKNKISIFSEVLTWKEGFYKVIDIAPRLAALVLGEEPEKTKEPKATIDKIRNSATIYKNIHRRILRGETVNVGVAKLFYFIRHSRNEQELRELIIASFAKDLIAVFADEHTSNPMKYPLIARYAEFLTRNAAS